jgi:hypothetical protein
VGATEANTAGRSRTNLTHRPGLSSTNRTAPDGRRAVLGIYGSEGLTATADSNSGGPSPTTVDDSRTQSMTDGRAWTPTDGCAEACNRKVASPGAESSAQEAAQKQQKHCRRLPPIVTGRRRPSDQGRWQQTSLAATGDHSPPAGVLKQRETKVVGPRTPNASGGPPPLPGSTEGRAVGAPWTRGNGPSPEPGAVPGFTGTGRRRTG